MPTTPLPSVQAVVQRAREWIDDSHKLRPRFTAFYTQNLVRDLLALVEDGPHRQALKAIFELTLNRASVFYDVNIAERIGLALRDADAQLKIEK